MPGASNLDVRNSPFLARIDRIWRCLTIRCYFSSFILRDVGISLPLKLLPYLSVCLAFPEFMGDQVCELFTLPGDCIWQQLQMGSLDETPLLHVSLQRPYSVMRSVDCTQARRRCTLLCHRVVLAGWRRLVCN